MSNLPLNANVRLDLCHMFIIGTSGTGNFQRLECTLYVRELEGYSPYLGLNFGSHRTKTVEEFERDIQAHMHEFYTEAGWTE